LILLTALAGVWIVLELALNPAFAETRIVPSISVSERYDSNVFFSPQSFVPNHTLWDVVTTVTGNVNMVQASRLIKSSLQAGTTLNGYVNNPGLNYVAGTGVLSLNLDNLFRRSLGGRGHLQVDDSVSYTPEQPSFLTPKAQPGPLETRLIGIQAFRSSSLVNAGVVRGSYDITSKVSLNASYLHSLYHFFHTFVTPGGVSSVFDTTTRTATGGATVIFSGLDTGSVTYLHSTTTFGPAAGFDTDTVMAEYRRKLSSTFVSTLNFGVTQIQPGTIREPVGGAALYWTVTENERWQIKYTRGVTANFFLVASALISQRVDVGVVHQFSKTVALTASVNYALNETTSTPVFRIVSYGAEADLTYRWTRHISSMLSFKHFNYDYGSFQFDRNVVMFSLNARWP
jgi:hypothetical protein